MIVALTGSIAAGKSTVGDVLRNMGATVFDADAVVHNLMRNNNALRNKIAADFPDCMVNNAIDRRILGSIVFNDFLAKKKFESIIHPMVENERRIFLKKNARCKLEVCDIPLLFEVGLNKQFNHIWVVSTPNFIQRRRAMLRTTMTQDKLRAIIAAQWPDKKKCNYATAVINTGAGMRLTIIQIKRLLITNNQH